MEVAMSYISVSHITLMSHMQRDDMHSLLPVASWCFNELPPLRVAYATGMPHLPVDIRHI
jgi:hypothetical protein